MSQQFSDLIAILGFNRYFAKEHRIRNEIKVFSPKYTIDGYGSDTVEGAADFYIVKRPVPLLRRTVILLGGFIPLARIWFEIFFYRHFVKQIKAKGYRFLIAHHIDDALVALKTGVPFLFHSHEYLPRQFDGNRLFRFTEIRYRDKALQSILSRAVLTVVEGETVALQYATTYGIPEDRLIIMPSMPQYRTGFDRVDLPHLTINLIHHGALVPERGLELLMDVTNALGDEYRLTLMGPGPADYVNSLRQYAIEAGNIDILAPVPYEQIVEKLHGHDLGLVIFGSPHFHHKYMTVPNKFWECLQARVPVLVSPESAMANYVRESGCGLVATSASLEGYVAAIRSLSRRDITALKELCEDARWCHRSEAYWSSLFGL
jgi:glycosyltransferase involved in cell wall biosynthesis